MRVRDIYDTIYISIFYLLGINIFVDNKPKLVKTRFCIPF